MKIYNRALDKWVAASGSQFVDIATKINLDASLVRMVHRCDCEQRGGACTNAPQSAGVGYMINVCPWAHARNPQFQAVAMLVRALDAGAVIGWPDAFAAGIVDGVHTLRSARDEWQARKMREGAR